MVRSRIPAFALVALAATAGGFDDAGAAPETFNTALPVAEGEFLFRGQFLYMRASDDPTRADRDAQIFGGISVVGYGATSDLALFGILPYLDKRLDMTVAPGIRVARHASGIGDAQIFTRYTLFQKDMPGRNFRIAPFIGVEAPTGDDSDSDGLGRLPAMLQPGSGSWNPFGGLIVTYQTLDYEADAQLSYKANTEAHGFSFGDEFHFDTSFQYRMWPRDLGGGVPGFLYGVIETNLSHQEKNRSGGVDDPDSGGTKLFLSPGLQYVTRRWVLEAVVQVPVVQDLNGSALKDDYAVRAGFRVNF